MDTSFEEPVVTLQYIPSSLPPVQDNVPPSVNPPFLSIGANDTTNIIQSHYMLIFQSFQPCLDHEEYIIPPIDHTPTYDETIEDDIIN